jgi:hypothetical protein
MRYHVESYESCEHPMHWMSQGRFETAAEAVARADQVLRESLESLYRENCRHGKRGAEHLLSSFQCFGEMPAIFGEPKVAWSHIRRVRRMIELMTGERLAANA